MTIKKEKMKELFEGAMKMVETVLDLEMDYSSEISKVVHTENKSYIFSVKIQPKEVQER